MSYWKTGQLIQRGKYIIEKVLGAGGAGITYRAKEVNTGKIIAIKTLNATLQAQPDFSKHQERFIQEAFRLAKCNHTHVIQVDDVCQEGELWCMMMEYIDGGNLETLVKREGGFSEVEAIRYIYQVGSALSYIHDQGILHRDVKPANIMVRGNTNEAVLIDFGLARDFVEDKTQMHTNSRTEGFAPIEQYSRNAKRGAYTDVYALAGTLYYLLTLQVPFPAQFRQQGINLVPPQQHNSNISDRTNLVILKGMELLPENRPESVAEWLNFLTENNEIELSSSHPTIKTIPSQNPQPQVIKRPETSSEIPVLSVPPVPPVPPRKKVKKVSKKPPVESQTVEGYDPLSPTRFENNLYRNYYTDEEHQDISAPNSSPVTDDSTAKTELATNQNDQTLVESPLPPQQKKKNQKRSFSEVGIDYKPLAELLYKQEWEKADKETQNLMLQAAGQVNSAWIDRKAMGAFPCRDLETIDKLWVKYSRGKFGISVQKRIYLSLGGKRLYDKKTWEALGDRVGWRVNGTWLFPEDLNYATNAPQGHLPSIAMSGLLDRGIYTLISRTMDCDLS